MDSIIKNTADASSVCAMMHKKEKIGMFFDNKSYSRNSGLPTKSDIQQILNKNTYMSINQFSDKFSRILSYSKEEGMRLSCSSIGPEHLLLGMLREDDSAMLTVLAKANINVQSFKQGIEAEIKNNTEYFAFSNGDFQISPKANNILKLAVLEARMESQTIVSDTHLLLAILHDQQNTEARAYLEGYNIDYDSVKRIFCKSDMSNPKNGLGMPEEDEEEESIFNGKKSTQRAGASTMRNAKGDSKTPILDNFGIDLTKAATEGKLDPVVGREKEIQRVTEILCRRKKNNPILIGEPGVGKSAIVEGLALLISSKSTSPVLFGKRLVTLDMAAIVAGTKYRGQFEERMKALVKELEDNPDIIVFIDEIHTLVGAGSAPGSMDAANLLKPSLARGTIQCIGATTFDEYRNSIEKDGALERRFQKVIVEPTTVEETETILNNIKGRYEEHHHVKYTDDAIKACVKMTDRYVSDRQFPDKAIDVLDEAGAKTRLKNMQVPPELREMEEQISELAKKKQMAIKKQNFELAASFRDKQQMLAEEIKKLQERISDLENEKTSEVTGNDIAEVVSLMSGVPVQKISESESMQLKDMAQLIKNEVVAQDAAVDKTVKAIQRNRLGLRDPHHPIGAFMFLGPTGVGKTYLAKKLAEHMFGSSDAVIRIDMSEYSESFNTSRLVGAPPGYVGYEEGGQLTERVRRHPYSIVLLDEIEKAHGNVFNMLLQVLDEGRLTDGNGRLVDFSNTVIIMTSNAGTRQLKDFGKGIGFNAAGLSSDMKDTDKEYARSIIQKSLSKQFSPEFLNRLDEIITFDQLDLQAIKKIIDIELKGLAKRIGDLGYSFTLSDAAKELVATKGYDVQFGARPLKRAIQTYIEDGICEMMLSDKLAEGDTIFIGKNPNREELTFKVKRENNG